jgi:hypothetical protein
MMKNLSLRTIIRLVGQYWASVLFAQAYENIGQMLETNVYRTN